MTDSVIAAEAAEIARRAAALLGRRVERITAPAGREQASWRIHLSDDTMIVTRRVDPERAARERMVLSRLAPLTDAVPRILAAEDELTIQALEGEALQTAETYEYDEADSVPSDMPVDAN